MKALWFCFMSAAAGFDLWKREIPGWLFALSGIVGAVGLVIGLVTELPGALGGDLAGIAGSIAVGAGLLLVSRASDGAVGEGDGWFFLASGLYLSWQMNLALLCVGLLFCSIYGMGFIMWGSFKGISVRKKKIAFLPFVWIAGILILLGGGVT